MSDIDRTNNLITSIQRKAAHAPLLDSLWCAFLAPYAGRLFLKPMGFFEPGMLDLVILFVLGAILGFLIGKARREELHAEAEKLMLLRDQHEALARIEARMDRRKRLS